MNQRMQWHYCKVLSCCLLYLLTFLQAQVGESIAVLDLEGRGISSFEAAERLFYQHPHIKVIILTIYNTEEYRAKAEACGAVAFVPKQDAVEGLEAVINKIIIESE